ncbi:unnamed protein product, partial [Aureobasidium uvarum]
CEGNTTNPPIDQTRHETWRHHKDPSRATPGTHQAILGASQCRGVAQKALWTWTHRESRGTPLLYAPDR